LEPGVESDGVIEARGYDDSSDATIPPFVLEGVVLVVALVPTCDVVVGVP
jgi:hypothetical protein